ncbi:hypothetical protein HZA87_01105 [Candidatus Uhrbacteria bacterium]|nr:hypothetical protein [Candidatus Uhrbacteria bacterium]
MTRVEKNASVREKLEEMKGSVVREVREHNRKRRPMLTCSLVFLFLVACFFSWMAWVVASTGLVYIPLFTTLAYDKPEPIHAVEPGIPVDVFVKDSLTEEVTKRLQSGSGELKDRAFTLTLSEASLTASIRSLIEESGLTFLDGSEAQVALDGQDGAELFVPLSKNTQASAISLMIDVGAKDGKISIAPTRLRVGSLSIPHFILVNLLDPFLKQELAKLNDALIGYARLNSIVVAQGAVTLTGELSVEVR